MIRFTEELEKVSLVESLVEDGFSEDLAESVADSLYNPQEPAYVCNTQEELSAVIAEMSKKDE